jgi:hypothetical protein
MVNQPRTFLNILYIYIYVLAWKNRSGLSDKIPVGRILAVEARFFRVRVRVTVKREPTFHIHPPYFVFHILIRHELH